MFAVADLLFSGWIAVSAGSLFLKLSNRSKRIDLGMKVGDQVLHCGKRSFSLQYVDQTVSKFRLFEEQVDIVLQFRPNTFDPLRGCDVF